MRNRITFSGISLLPSMSLTYRINDVGGNTTFPVTAAKLNLEITGYIAL
jgi:hypothetical protein